MSEARVCGDKTTGDEGESYACSLPPDHPEWGMRHAHIEGGMILATWGEPPKWAAMKVALAALAENDTLVDGAIVAAEKAGVPADVVEHLHEINNALYRRRLRHGIGGVLAGIQCPPNCAHTGPEHETLLRDALAKHAASETESVAKTEHRRVAGAAERALDILSPVVAEMVEPVSEELLDPASDAAAKLLTALRLHGNYPLRYRCNMDALLTVLDVLAPEAATRLRAGEDPGDIRKALFQGFDDEDTDDTDSDESVEPLSPEEIAAFQAMAEATFPEVDGHGLPRLSKEQADRFVEIVSKPNALLPKSKMLLMGEAAEVVWLGALPTSDGQEPSPVAVVREAARAGCVRGRRCARAARVAAAPRCPSAEPVYRSDIGVRPGHADAPALQRGSPRRARRRRRRRRFDEALRRGPGSVAKRSGTRCEDSGMLQTRLAPVVQIARCCVTQVAAHGSAPRQARSWPSAKTRALADLRSPHQPLRATAPRSRA